MNESPKAQHVKKSISLPEDMLTEATAKAEKDPRYRTLSGYVQNLIDRDLKAALLEKKQPEEAAA